jgi:hypothetical protein
VLVLAVTLLNPQALGPLNRAWFKFGLVLSSIMTPVIMGFLFLVAIVPTALILRCRGRNLLDLEFDPDAASYWIVRDPPGPMPETMRNQF